MRILVFLFLLIVLLSSSPIFAGKTVVYVNSKKIEGPFMMSGQEVYGKIEEFARVVKERITWDEKTCAIFVDDRKGPVSGWKHYAGFFIPMKAYARYLGYSISISNDASPSTPASSRQVPDPHVPAAQAPTYPGGSRQVPDSLVPAHQQPITFNVSTQKASVPSGPMPLSTAVGPAADPGNPSPCPFQYNEISRFYESPVSTSELGNPIRGLRVVGRLTCRSPLFYKNVVVTYNLTDPVTGVIVESHDYPVGNVGPGESRDAYFYIPNTAQKLDNKTTIRCEKAVRTRAELK